MPLTLYNSLSRSQERFQPIDPADVRVYTCGPTVYNHQHIGNMRAFLFADTLVRTLRWQGFPVRHVINITDVGHLTSDADAGDDKMEAAARREARSIWDIARHYTDAFKRDVERLAIVPPTLWSVATDHIPEMIAFAQTIAERHCYTLPDGLYFDVSTVSDYGRLARATDDTGESRIAPVAGKRHAQDFAIWRTSAADERRQMEWDSPWGRGAPGWHLECSVMSGQHLGLPFDIHTGGIDHREIHHPNEIAQNQAHCGRPDIPAFTGATFWMHNNFLVERAEKMSKSSGGFLTLQTLVDRGFHPLSYRLMCLQAHYRSELEFSWESLAAAQTRLKRLAHAVAALRNRPDERPGAPAGAYVDQLKAAVFDDLNTPRALPVLEELLADKLIPPSERLRMLPAFDAVLGLDLAELRRVDLRVRPAGALIDEAGIAARLVDRREARAAKDFGRSDAIRVELADAGVEVMDGDPLGWDWRT